MDVRDCGEIHALIAESTNTRNGQRYMCSAHDDSGLLNIFQLRAKLKRLFPDINVRPAKPAGLPSRANAGPVCRLAAPQSRSTLSRTSRAATACWR